MLEKGRQKVFAMIKNDPAKTRTKIKCWKKATKVQENADNVEVSVNQDHIWCMENNAASVEKQTTLKCMQKHP